MTAKLIKHYIRRVRRLRREIAGLDARLAIMHASLIAERYTLRASPDWYRKQVEEAQDEADKQKRKAATYYTAWQAALKSKEE